MDTIMTERIEKLALQAGVSLTKEAIDGNGHKFEYTDENQFKFAELIIQECLDVLNKRFMGDLNREDMEVLRCVEDVERHFGMPVV